MTHLHSLHNKYDQSPWLDNLSRELVESGRLKKYIDDGVRGLTSNPTILEKAIKSSSDYDQPIKDYASRDLSNEEIFFKLAMQDIRSAAKELEPIWEESGGEDGYVSLEVSPALAEDTDATIKQAKWLWEELNIPNLMIKIPATPAGLPAIKETLASGINVNVTLIFSLARYQDVITAFKDTHLTGSNNKARSVASFFVSRIDSEVDKRLEAIGSTEALALRGKAAIAQAIVAYDIFLDRLGKEAVIDSHGPSVQRLLLASTSTKNPEYDDLLYVSNLLAPLSVNTLPEETISKILDHLPETDKSISMIDIDSAHKTLAALKLVGIDMDDV
ncbi:transaldolase, partial [Candidatus Saccharibacteria bacterium]|nr:transaldolase [Candidatus Saccharibacteria bacterium]